MEKVLYVELLFMPDPEKNPLEIEEKIKQLKERIINTQSPNYFFKRFYENFSLPIQTFGLYMQSIWNKILNNKNNRKFKLELSETKELIINIMFETFQNNVYKEILMSYVMKMKKQIIQEKQYIDLSVIAKEIFAKAESSFQKCAENFHKNNEFFYKMKELSELIKQDLLDIFKQQTSILIKNGPKNLIDIITNEKLTGISTFFSLLLIVFKILGKSSKIKEKIEKIKNQIIISTIEKINRSQAFQDEFWNVDSEIENYEQMMNFHCIMILENFLNEMIQNLIDENFEEFRRKRGRNFFFY